MKRSLFAFLILLIPCVAGAQYDKQGHPVFEVNDANPYHALLNNSIREALAKIDWNHAAKSSQNDTALYIIPTVVHIVHDYGAELLPDTLVSGMIQMLNNYFSKNIPDTALIIDKFKPIAANTRIAFRLARRDPGGNPTRGVEHINSYLTSQAYDQSKLSDWPPDKYVNIWVVKNSVYNNAVGGFTYYPFIAQSIPYYDGILTSYDYFASALPLVVLSAQYLDLKWMCSGYDPDTCIDGDGIPDTPPCNFHNSCLNLYDTLCDTPNVQNIMGSFCQIMFTNGQATAMTTVLNQNVANRNILVSAGNRIATGMDLPLPDMPPVPDFSVNKGKVIGIPPAERTYFYCADDTDLRFSFTDYSWNDTVTSVHWHFSNGAATVDTTVNNAGKTIYNSFAQPGWVTISLTATGNNTGSATLTDTQVVYAADGNDPIIEDPANGPMHFMEFDPGQTDNWPIFNYYKNNFKWQLNNNTGYYDNTSMEYMGFDTRQFPDNTTGGPAGDFDDFFSPAYDLSAMSNGYCNLNFMSAGACRNTLADMKDTLEVKYSIDCGRTWKPLLQIGGAELDNNGSLATAYAPLWSGEWKLNSVELPQDARSGKTFFRFRYRPGTDSAGYSTSNNFYIDRISISNFPTGVGPVSSENGKITLAPNPADAITYLVITGNKGQPIAVNITDVSGRVVYHSQRALQSEHELVGLPTKDLANGIYFVVAQMAGMVSAQKLLVRH
jgi:hypothetical protein